MASSTFEVDPDNRVHFVGAGGVSMSALAALYLKEGGEVTGSDIKKNSRITNLIEKGADISIGHKPENIDDQDLLVKSTAIPEGNSEVQQAAEKGIPVISRAEFLAGLAADKKQMAVSGTHGKTTTTAMLTEIFLRAGRDPGVMLGGELVSAESNHISGEDEYFIFEADESDGSLVYYSPWLAIITNLEAEHLNFYEDEIEIADKMKEFINRIESGGFLILCNDDPLIRTQIKPYAEKRDINIITYGINSGDYKADQVKTKNFKASYQLKIENNNVSRDLKVNLPGRCSVLNSLAAAAAARAAGVDWNAIEDGLDNFKGVRRRFEVKGMVDDIQVIDDYAHHPTEIFATYLTAARSEPSRIITIFQPHRFTRTRALWSDFVCTLSRIDYLLVCDIYPANQEPIEGINSRRLIEEIKKEKGSFNGWTKYSGTPQEAADFLLDKLDGGDLVLTLGAGDVYRAGETLLEKMRSRKD